MQALLGIGVLAMIAACVVVGTRLLWLSTRTRRSPEFLLGTAFVLLGGIGYPLAIAARGGPGGSPSPGLLRLALGFQDVACLAMYAATWQTFHSGSRSAGGITALAAVGFGASVMGVAGSGSPDHGAWYYIGFALRAGCFGWAAVESHRYQRLLKRRLRIGLGDAVVADRFRLWTISTVAIFLGFGIFLVGHLTTDNVAPAGWVLAATSAVSLTAAACMWLAFVPPAAYVRRVSAATRGAY
ncbi:MAG: hypothetical protein ACE5FL_13030 [Myxococcota bacterium]